jgi:hypothetical protein
MKVALSGLLVVAACGAASAQPQRFNADFSTMQESGPPVAGGNGATAGPNWKNQAMLPMPGSQELSELPRNREYPLLDAPLPPKPAAPPVKSPKRAQQ